MTIDLLTAPEIAAAIGANPKSLRRFIRSQDAACGKGKRYGFTPEEAKALVRDFRAAATATKAPARSADEVRALIAD